MGAWEVNGPAKGTCKSWRDAHPELAAQVAKITAPRGRGIAWEGTEIWAYRDRPRSISECLAANVARWPEREAYVFHPGGERMTWGDVGAQVTRAAAGLRQKFGFKKRDRLCLLTAGCPEYVISYLAIIQLGGVAVPVNLGLTAEGLAAQINKVGAKGLVVSSEVWSKLDSVRGGLDSVEVVFVIGSKAPQGALAFSELSSLETTSVEHEAVDEWDLCAISFTSGTTGVPKGTMAMHINALGCAQNVVIAAKGLGADDVNLCMPPLYHNTAVYADFLPALLSGGKCVVMAAFTPLDGIKLIEAERATWAVAAPIMLWMMMNHPEFKKHDCSTLKKIIFGGHASSETFINQLNLEFAPIAMVNAGSVSESTALGFALPTEDAIRKITSCGLATPNTDIAIFDDAGNEVLEPNVIGEVAYRGQQTNAGYWEEPGKTAEVFRRDGFVLSGDWAKIDEEGYLWLLDRKKDMVVRGGQNVYCIEVENKLYLHPKVLRAAVVGVPDHVFSERLKAVVVLKPGETATADEIRDHCAQHLARYETPEYVVFGANLPANPAGKTLKPPLVDFWGDSLGTSLARFSAFCASLSPALFDMPHLKLDGEPVTPREALGELEKGSERGQHIARIIEERGVCGLTTPDEARFRKSAEAGPGDRVPRAAPPARKGQGVLSMLNLDFADPKTNADPFPIFAQLRESDPVHWSSALKAWVITRYDDVRRVAVSNSDMSAERLAPFFATVPVASQGGYANLMTYLGKWMVFRDPPEHARLRRLFTKAFTSRSIKALEPNVEEIVALLFDEMEKKARSSGVVDWIADFAYPLPATVMMDLLGVPRDDLHRVKDWSDDIALFIGTSRATADKYIRAEAGAKAMADYFRDIIAKRTVDPQGDIISQLVTEPDKREALTEDEVIATCILLLFAGHETTTNMLGNGFYYTMSSPEQWARVKDDPSLAETAVEEWLRYDGPSGALVRVITADVEFGGRKLLKGQRLFAFINAANRDPEHFGDADRFDLGRSPNPHLTFGHGIHFCLGAQLARLEGQIALRSLIERFPGISLAADSAPGWKDSIILRGLQSLPVRLR